MLGSLKNRLDFGVEGDVRVGKAVDVEALPAHIGEVEESADVVVLIENAEDALGLLPAHAKACERRWVAKSACQHQILFDNFAEAHRGCESLLRHSCRPPERSYPDVGAGLAIRHIDVKQVGLVARCEHRAKPCRAMLRAEPPPRRSLDPVDLIQVRDLFTPKPQPDSGSRTLFAAAAGFCEPLLNGA